MTPEFEYSHTKIKFASTRNSGSLFALCCLLFAVCCLLLAICYLLSGILISKSRILPGCPVFPGFLICPAFLRFSCFSKKDFYFGDGFRKSVSITALQRLVRASCVCGGSMVFDSFLDRVGVFVRGRIGFYQIKSKSNQIKSNQTKIKSKQIKSMRFDLMLI